MTNADLIALLLNRPANETVVLLNEVQFANTGGIEGKYEPMEVEVDTSDPQNTKTVIKFNLSPI